MCPDKNIPVDQRVETNAFRSRRKTTRKRLSYLLLTTLVMVGTVWVLREPMARREMLSGMGQLGHHITYYQTTHKKLPSTDDILSFNIYSRSLSLTGIQYQPDHILPNSPPETILANSPLREFNLLPSGHAVLRVDGQTEWLRPADLAARLTDRQKRFNAARLATPPSTLPQ